MRHQKTTLSILLVLSLAACKGGGSDGNTDDTEGPNDTQVENSAPVIESITLSPELPLTADAIVATVSASDADGDTLTYSYAWTVDGQAAGSDSDTLPAELSAKGQSVAVTVTVDDGSESVSQESAARTIANTLPVLEEVRIGPAGATTRDDLKCNVPTAPTDADSDALTGTLLWRQNGVEVSPLGADRKYPGDTVLASQTDGDDVWSCEVTISDGEAEVSQRAEVTLPPSLEVLVIWDVADLGTPELVQALEDAGLNVTLSDTDENSFDGSNPSLSNFDAVVHLNGTTYSGNMVESGQQALVDFVNDGGGYVHTEWNAYEVSDTSGATTLASIQLLARDSGASQGPKDYTVTLTHPVVANVPTTFTTTGYCSGNIGSATNGGMVLATTPEYGDAVVVTEIGDGRVVGFAHSANFSNSSDTDVLCLSDAYLLQMMVDAVSWTLD
jgi:hypothetical protein